VTKATSFVWTYQGRPWRLVRFRGIPCSAAQKQERRAGWPGCFLVIHLWGAWLVPSLSPRISQNSLLHRVPKKSLVRAL